MSTTTYVVAAGVGLVVLYIATQNKQSGNGSPYVHPTKQQDNGSAPSGLSAGGLTNPRGVVENTMRFSTHPQLQRLSEFPPGVALYPIADHISAVQWAAIGGTDRRIPITTRNLDLMNQF